MSFGQAILYFLREAVIGLWRSWKVTLVAVLTISVGLFVGGMSLLVTRSLSETLEGWGDQLQVTLYLDEEADEPPSGLLDLVASGPRVESINVVSKAQAVDRFRANFPTLAEALNAEDRPFPASVELRLSPGGIDRNGHSEWLLHLREHPAVDMVDDDREWLANLEVILGLAKWLGTTLAIGLMAAAVFTTAAVVRLAAYLHLDEIAVMRLVGATEFLIRGPFFAEGLLQGLLGGCVASALLNGTATWLAEHAADLAWLMPMASLEVSLADSGLLLAVGATAGLLGAVLSLRRESLQIDESAAA